MEDKKEKKKTSLATWFFALIFFSVMIQMVGQLSGSNSSNNNGNNQISQNTPKPKSQKDEIKEKINFENSWSKGGFDSIMMLDFKVTNKSNYSIKDFVIECTSSSNSGTKIDFNKKTVYEIVKAGQTKKMNDFSMGFIHSQATKSFCEITDFEIIN